MNYHHLSIEERSCIRKYYVDGLSYREIARLIGRNVSTVSREIRRNCTHMYDIPTYYPHTAQKKYLLRRSYCHRGMFHSQEVIDYIEEKLRATWSPEQISCTPCELKMPSWRTIYRWLYEKYLVNGNLKVLRRKGKSHGVKETRGKYSKGKSIRKRDKSVYSRQEAGHWEADTSARMAALRWVFFMAASSLSRRGRSRPPPAQRGRRPRGPPRRWWTPPASRPGSRSGCRPPRRPPTPRRRRPSRRGSS